MAPVMAGAKKPVADPTVLVSPLMEPAKLGAMSCSDTSEPLLTVPKQPTATHSTVMATAELQLTHVMATRAAADPYRPIKYSMSSHSVKTILKKRYVRISGTVFNATCVCLYIFIVSFSLSVIMDYF